MAQKLLKKKPRKIAPKKDPGGGACPHAAAVVVGTYKDRQLAWIKRHGIYNYPVREGDEFDAKAFAAVKELWLYADAKGTRHVFEAEFVGVKTREELIRDYGYPGCRQTLFYKSNNAAKTREIAIAPSTLLIEISNFTPCEHARILA